MPTTPFARDSPARCAIRSLTTESTEATEAGRKGFQIWLRTLPFHPSPNLRALCGRPRGLAMAPHLADSCGRLAFL
jgi:hypothetical protein